MHPLPIVKRVSVMKPHKSRLLGIVKGGCICTPSVEFLHTPSSKTGHGNLKIGQRSLYVPVSSIHLYANNSSNPKVSTLPIFTNRGLPSCITHRMDAFPNDSLQRKRDPKRRIWRVESLYVNFTEATINKRLRHRRQIFCFSLQIKNRQKR